MIQRPSLLAACAALALMPAIAFAQTPPAPSLEPDPPGETLLVPGEEDPCLDQPGSTADGLLTDQLDECGGVLVPPQDGSAGIEAPVPDADPGTTPVIPPGTLPSQPQPNPG